MNNGIQNTVQAGSKMFCYQCQETMQGSGCTRTGVCGKRPALSAAQDRLVHAVRCLSAVTTQLRRERKTVDVSVNRLICSSLLLTMTNACFDTEMVTAQTARVLQTLRELFPQSEKREELPEAAVFLTIVPDPDAMPGEIGVLGEADEDIRSFRELITYGIKGIAAMLDMANRLGADDDDVNIFLQRALGQLLDKTMTGGNLLALVMETGRYVIRAMDLQDRAARAAYGDPDETMVPAAVRNNPAVLVSGSSLKDLAMVLEQTAGTGIDVYTHGELSAAHAYPAFRKYPHLVGQYGGAWWKQKEEFESFRGPVLVTSDNLVPPKENTRGRIFTTGAAAWPGCTYIEEDENGNKDFAELIRMAHSCPAPEALPYESYREGFSHVRADALAEQLHAALKDGRLQKIVFLAGSDGRSKSRSYYTDFVRALPKDTVILTAGDVKERFIRTESGEDGGIPRVVSAGAVQDVWSLIMLIMKLRELTGAESLSQLPLTWNYSWYSQRSTAVLLALLYMDIRHIHLGPSMPAFLSPNVRNLMEKYMGLEGTTKPQADAEAQMGGSDLLIRPDMIVGDIVREYPSLAAVMAENGLHCIGCGVAKTETLEEACAAHGINLQDMLEMLNDELTCL